MSRPQRIRRTPEEAKSTILDIAAARLIQYGIKGLNVKAVALDAGINHATILHHFGSAEGMRMALLSRMSEELTIEMSELVNQDISPADIFVRLFHLMSQSGHIKLFAWRAMDEVDDEPQVNAELGQKLFQDISDRISARLKEPDQTQIRNLIMLSVAAAVGWGICGNGFEKVFGIDAINADEKSRDNFPAWVGTVLPKVLQDEEID